MESIEEAERVRTRSASSISQEDIDAEIRRGYSFAGTKSRIYAMYQTEITAKDAIKALKREYGICGHSHTFLDGSSGFVDYRPASGAIFQRYQFKDSVTIKWPAIERRIRQMVAEGSYLSPAEMEKYQSDHIEPEQAAEPVPDAPGAITDADLDKLLVEDWGVTGRKQRISALFRQGLSDEQIAEHLRAEYNRRGYTAEERAHEGPCVLPDGGEGYGYFVAAEWRLRRRDADGPMRCVTYEEMSRHIRKLLDTGRYLTPEELEQPPVFEITQADIDAQLRFEKPFNPQNLRIYEIYQQNLSVRIQ